METVIHPLHREDEWGETPMDRGLRSGHAPMVDMLMYLDSHVDLHHDLPIIDAARQGDVAGVRECLEKGGDIDQEDELGVRLIHWAVITGSVDLLKLLINRGADVNARMHSVGVMTPLDMASRLGYTIQVDLLTQYGAVM